MALNTEQILKSVRKFRQTLKSAPVSPTPQEVHKLRTQARRVESVLEAFWYVPRRRGRVVLKQISRLHKRAGGVRDMDVLTAHLATIPQLPKETDCTVQLLEHLGAKRETQAAKLRRVHHRYSRPLRKHLKRCAQQMEKLLQRKSDQPGHNNVEPSSGITASALALVSDLAQTKTLNRRNLHSYRLRIKELRNLLQLARNAEQSDFVSRLGRAKDAIGEWHDWEELLATATNVLDHRSQCALINQLRKITETKYRTALAQGKRIHRDLSAITQQITSGRTRRASAPAYAATLALAM
jgi:CHAD domain-containing protein